MASIDNENRVRTGELTEKVWHHFGAGYTKLTQVRAATGYADLNTADMMVMGEWPSTGNELHGFEIKVSRSDWLNEVRNPHKNDSVKSYCDRWWLVIADEDMVKHGELPEDWGMMAFQGRGRKLKIVKKAPLLESAPLDKLFVASLLRHNDKETVPIDIHLDRIKDARRDAEAAAKHKADELYKFVRELSTGFGIEIKEHRGYDYTQPGRNKVFTKWFAQIKKTYIGELRADEFAALMRKASQVESVQSDVDHLRENLRRVISSAEGQTPDHNVEWALNWARWGLQHCNKVLEDQSTDAAA